MSNNKNLFDLAMGWYRSGDPGKKEAALELFPEDMLEREIENFKKRDQNERLKTRESELYLLLDCAKKMFPVGTIVWSDDGSDYCPNIIVSEPYIGTTEYGSHVPDGKYQYYDDWNLRKTILAKTIRINWSDVIDSKDMKSIVGLEKIIIETDSGNFKYNRKNGYFITPEEYHKLETVERDNQISNLKNSISQYEEKLQEFKKDLSAWENYDPNSLTEEKIKEMVNKYKW